MVVRRYSLMPTSIAGEKVAIPHLARIPWLIMCWIIRFFFDGSFQKAETIYERRRIQTSTSNLKSTIAARHRNTHTNRGRQRSARGDQGRLRQSSGCQGTGY